MQFLQTIMPRRPRSELYTALGLAGQGKTLFFRDLRHHLHHSNDLFVEAPGTRGLVMHVFNLPSYPYVFKVIRDRFGSSKNTDRETVMSKFRLVREVDRVGRMAHTIEFTNLALPLDRFAPELLEQLDELAPSSIELDGDNLIVKHCYVERRLTPLNVYFATASAEQIDRAVREYGDTIRELAIANVFPGDLIWRNFGLTRYDRVLFYDYDEVEYLTDCEFRAIPPPPTPEAELSAGRLVRRRAARRLPGGVRPVPARRRARARVVPAPPRRPAGAGVLARIAAAHQVGRDRRLLPLRGGRPLLPTLRRV